jgi:hypothetical protein
MFRRVMPGLLGRSRPGVALLTLLLGSALLVERARAQGVVPSAAAPPSHPSLPARLALAPVPRLQLTLPTAAGSPQREGAWPSYWRAATVPAEWRNATDGELRLELPMARLRLGRLSLSSLLVATPGRERDCLPDCRSPEWSSVLRLQHDLGDLGPLRHAGPQLELRGARPPGNAGQGRRYVGAGFGANF